MDSRISGEAGGIAVALLLLVLMGLAGVILGWMVLAPGLAARRLQTATGFTCELTAYSANPVGGSLRAGEFVLRNPARFPQRVFLRGRDLAARGGPGLPGRGGLDFQHVRLELDTVLLARDADGQDNFTAFAAALPPVRIREFTLVVASMPALPGQPGREAFARTYRDLDSLRPVLADLARLALAESVPTAPAPPNGAPAIQASPATTEESGPPKIEFRSRG